MKVVLVSPQIPQNCGNIVRTCAVTGCGLILIRPLGFRTSDRLLKRAGLDYWEGVDVEIIDSLEELLESQSEFYFFSSHAHQSYDQVSYSGNVHLVFGSETTGLPQELHDKYPDRFLRIPMRSGRRCLNLATSVGIGVYAAWRSNDYC
ncbi:MAG: tRNA (cytidine(34)-2'-O)-methyltransferase [Chlamydiia bacterium]|nr:tRNA (cytidine(34)-2'-O)-methyltransferase [Chlamydiia bacterium]